MSLNQLRTEIDRLDHNLIKILSKRKKVVSKILKEKSGLRLPVKDKVREKKMFEQRKKWSKEDGVDAKFIERLFQVIIKQSVKEQKEVKEK
ncbi:hypothetical protein COY27_04585 [Candidatus Woesearchaeota archaeon CG_4_10_14_0_2_um_filter_33_13]|nr:MAG: hypothetical protein COY27_04585 [Candidatus Woesearchaeota archaeon CG_4_10_14_0_2_um_filter_33_13]